MLEDAWRTELSREEIIAQALAAEGRLLDQRGLALGAVAGMLHVRLAPRPQRRRAS